METYENSFFRPKPRERKCCTIDEPCRVNSFSCTKSWWERNIKTFIDMAADEYGKSIIIDTDELEYKGTVDVRIDDAYVMTAKSKEEISTILKTIFSMLTLYFNPIEKPPSKDDEDDNKCCDDDCCDFVMNEL